MILHRHEEPPQEARKRTKKAGHCSVILGSAATVLQVGTRRCARGNAVAGTAETLHDRLAAKPGVCHSRRQGIVHLLRPPRAAGRAVGSAAAICFDRRPKPRSHAPAWIALGSRNLLCPSAGQGHFGCLRRPGSRAPEESGLGRRRGRRVRPGGYRTGRTAHPVAPFAEVAVMHCGPLPVRPPGSRFDQITHLARPQRSRPF